MMSAGVGGRLNVIGNSIAIVATGPMPGNTPISVPRKQPIKQYIKFCRLSATLKPRLKCWMSSVMVRSVYLLSVSRSRPGEKLERQAKRFIENRPHRYRHEDCRDNRFFPFELMTAERAHDDLHD